MVLILSLLKTNCGGGVGDGGSIGVPTVNSYLLTSCCWYCIHSNKVSTHSTVNQILKHNTMLLILYNIKKKYK